MCAQNLTMTETLGWGTTAFKPSNSSFPSHEDDKQVMIERI